MRLFNRQKSDEQILAALQPADQNSSRLNWRRIIVSVIVLILVILGILWLLGAFRSEPVAPQKPERPTISREGNEGLRNPAPRHTQGSTSPARPPATPSVPTGGQHATTATPAPAIPAGTPPLASTGPTETLAVFIIATLSGTVLYQFLLRRRVA